jgi:hypothetical protein
MRDVSDRADHAAEDDDRGMARRVETTRSTATRSMGRRRCLLALLPCVALASLGCSQGSARPMPTFEADMLKTAANFSVLGASTVTNTGPTVIAGDLGLSPGTAVTGFPPGLVNGATSVADAPAAQGQVDLDTAWTTLQGEPCGTTLTNPDLGGSTLKPGVYCFTSPAAALTGALTLDAEGNADAVFVFQIASTLTTASGSSVVGINGASGCNVFWELGSSATLGTGTHFQGNVLASASITATTGATIAGRLLAHTGAVTLDDDTITACAGSAVDAGTASKDAGQDSAVEKDAGHEASVDAGHDVATMTNDAGHDTSTGTPDAGQDAAADTGHDASTGPGDAGVDAQTDGGDAGCASSTPCP